MDFGKRFTALTGINITGIIHGVIESFADKSSYGLEESRHAPRRERGLSHPRGVPQISQRVSVVHNKARHPSTSLSHPSPPQNTILNNTDNSIHSGKTQASERMCPPIADVDDAAGFMAAARSLKMNTSYGTPPQPDDASVDGTVDSQNPCKSIEESDNKSAVDEFSTGCDASVPAHVSKGNEAEIMFENGTVEMLDTAPPLLTQDVGISEPERAAPEEEQSRENPTTFKTWGTPAVRDKPAAKVRRIIIRGLPSSWSTPDKVLSLVHGGMIESINITPSGNSAHVLFCEHEACKSFYANYPNGIDLPKDRISTVFVDMGEEVDVISSQLEFNISVGNTRVVRAVGVDMEVTMSQLIQMASTGNRKVEKIIDSYVPGFARNVTFRFCNIEDAVRFKNMLVRDKDWEHCNVQYAIDPCEMATGYHAD